MSSAITKFIIDPSGELWNAGELAARQAMCHLPIVATPQLLIDDLVMNKGYAGFQASDRACQVFVNPNQVRQPTIEKIQELVRRELAPLMISACYRERWDFRLHVTKSDGMDHITGCIVEAQGHRSNVFRCHKVTEAGLARSGRGPLTDVLELIRGKDGLIDDDFLSKLAQLSKRRFMVCRWRPEGRIWRIEYSGTGYQSSHIDVSQHRTVGNQPSFEYGCWIHDHYLEAMMRVTPTVEDVDALVMTPGVGRRHMRYRRLLAPMTDQHGNALLVSTSIRDATIDLGAGGADPGVENAPLSRD
ncbi:MAG: hypothetical protein JXQ99_27025 [Hyphomicrobiaceae bacterium]